MKYKDLRDFIAQLEKIGELKRVSAPVSTHLEMTEICDRVLRAQGPALLFENVAGHDMPVLANLFGTPRRVALGMGEESTQALREVGKLLAYLKEPEPPKGLKDAWDKWPILKQVLTMSPKVLSSAPCQEVVWEGKDVDLSKLPIQHCWPGDVAPLITWGLVVTRGPNKAAPESRHLSPAGAGAEQSHHALAGASRRRAGFSRSLRKTSGAAVPGRGRHRRRSRHHPWRGHAGAGQSESEYQFAGLLRGSKTELVKCIGSDLQVPASAEIVLEGVIHPGETALEGPYGDHTGYYNEQDKFPVFTIERITMRRDPIYHSTYTGKPPDEPAMLGVALNEVFVPLLQKQFPEIADFYLPPEGCSYRMAVVSIKKQYAGHAKRVMFGIWSFLRQFMYTKFIIVVDDDIAVRDWKEVMWAITTRMDPVRDTLLVENTPIDYLDFASPVSGLGGKMGLDATNKWPGETQREWGTPIVMDAAVKAKVDVMWPELGL